MKGWPPTPTHLRYSADCGYASLPPCNGESHHRIWAAAMSGSPYRRRCITSGPKVANRLTWAAPGTHGHELCWLPGRPRPARVARGPLAPGGLLPREGTGLGWRPVREGWCWGFG